MFLFWFSWFFFFFFFLQAQWTGISLYWLQLFYVPTTELEGLLWYPVIFTGSLQGRISTQGDACNLYRERVCSVVWWNTAKSLCNILHHFSCLLHEKISKICKKFNSHDGFLWADQEEAKDWMCFLNSR